MTLNADVANKPAVKSLHLVKRGSNGEPSYAEAVSSFVIFSLMTPMLPAGRMANKPAVKSLRLVNSGPYGEPSFAEAVSCSFFNST
jgi:hypothetical protein